jgi:hypothetical protein
MTKAWRAARRSIETKYKGAKGEYLTVVEATQRGWPHLHVLTTRRWIDQKYLSELWATLTGAPIVHIERVQHQSRAAQYVAKYLGKAPHRFLACKRYYFTRGYIKKPTNTAPPFDWTKAEHETLNGDASFMAVALIGSGYDMLAARDGFFILGRPPPPVFNLPVGALPAA